MRQMSTQRQPDLHSYAYLIHVRLASCNNENPTSVLLSSELYLHGPQDDLAEQQLR